MNKKYKNSLELLERAKKVTPVAAQTYSKSYRYFCEGSSPAFLERGEGCYVWDVDGNKYVDFVCALGPITVGYNDERVNKAIYEQLHKGVSFSLPVKPMVELAEKLTEIIPCVEMVRFVKNGSDATSAAVRLARAYTGRDIIVCCGYHGMQDWYIGSTDNNKGIPKNVSEMTKKFEYNNIHSLKEIFERYSNNIAGVILEPIQGNGPREGFLDEVKELVHSYDSILIFDEVVSGFRYALGGAAELYNVVPDMVCFGKGMANGFPISAVGGKRKLLELIEKENVFVSTTFGGEALSIVGALETIKILEQEGAYDKIWKLGTLMKDGLELLINEFNLNDVVTISGLPPHIGLIFNGIGTLNYLDINSIYAQRMVGEGILTIGINNFNLSHSVQEIELFLSAAKKAFQEIRKAIENDSLEGILKSGKVNPVFKRNIK